MVGVGFGAELAALLATIDNLANVTGLQRQESRVPDVSRVQGERQQP